MFVCVVQVAYVVAKECRAVHLQVLLLVICSIENVAISSTKASILWLEVLKAERRVLLGNISTIAARPSWFELLIYIPVFPLLFQLSSWFA